MCHPNYSLRLLFMLYLSCLQASSWGTGLNMPNGPSGCSTPRRNVALLRPLVARVDTAYVPSGFSKDCRKNRKVLMMKT